MSQPCFTDKLTTAINSGCQNQTVGVERDAIYVPRTYVDVEAITYEASSVIIDNITLLGASHGYKISENKDMPFKGTKIDGERGEFLMKFATTFQFLILGNSPAKVAQLMQLANDEGFIILQNKSYSAAEKNKYMLLAPSKGLTLKKGSFSMEGQDTFGWAVEMGETDALIPVAFIWKTDEATTDAMVAALLV